MKENSPTTPHQRKCNTESRTLEKVGRRIVLSLKYEEYENEMKTGKTARACLAEQMEAHPELFPEAMLSGYVLNGWTEKSQKMADKRFRRVQVKKADGEQEEASYTVVSCDVLPYMSGSVSDVEKGLFLMQFGVPAWALSYVFGKNDSYWYRQAERLGRYAVVGTTVKDADHMPQDVLADEKHTKGHGQPWYVATTVAQDCVLGASVAMKADAMQLQAAYGIFKQEAQWLVPTYQPVTVNTDGWKATGRAWLNLFPKVTVIICFLHAFIQIRKCCKRLGTVYTELKQQVWDSYHAADKAAFHAQIDTLQRWTLMNRKNLSHHAKEAIDKLLRRADKFALAYDHPTAYRTSNMLDRQMEPMARWLAMGRHFHGHRHSAELRCRAWALLHNFWPYCPRSVVSETFISPAHKLNGFVYRDNWLENLLVSSSCQGVRFRHRIRQN